MAKSKKVQMPAGIRNKLMAAVAMLLVSSIMMVSSTYAWFTLSTAPEVTGITTSVGANGNLEIALLTTGTYTGAETISSAVGDSSAVKDVLLSNITWGNLVDLSSSTYGLSGIQLMPAAANTSVVEVTDGDGNATSKTTISVTNPLVIAEYGADGRVKSTDGQTVSTVANSNGIFAYDTSVDQTYGVRAIGVTSNLSVREIALKNAKTTVANTPNTAKGYTKSAIYSNMSVMLGYAMEAQGGEAPDSYTQEDLTAFVAIANGVIADLNALETGYRNAAIAYTATTTTDDDAFAAAKATVEGMTLAELAATDGLSALSEQISDLAAAQSDALAAKTVLATAAGYSDGIPSATEGAPSLDDVNAAVKKLVNGIEGDTDATPVVVNITGGAVGELGAQVGTFVVAEVGSLGTVYAGAANVTTGTFNNVVLATSGLSITSTGSTASNITDTYGYIIDFAFRTNAADSFLQLQTAAVNRVYSDETGADLATQGGGSTVTFAYTAGMTLSQVEKLLGAVRIVFLDTATGEVYANAGLTDISVNSTEATANVKLLVAEGADADNIVALNQNEIKKISVLVYLDGNVIDNSAVSNAATSGALNLNLQFSSSANLIPMQNTALQQLTSYTVTFDANGGTGLMTAAKVSGTSYTLPTSTSFYAPAGKEFKGWGATADATEAALITTLDNLSENVTVYAVWGTPADSTTNVGDYTVTVNSSTTGTVTADKTTANEDDTVTLTVTPGTGYVLDTLTVAVSDGTTVPVTGNAFTMPAGNVTVSATFVDDPDTYRVTFNNGSTPITVAITDISGAPNVTDTDSHTFLGWSEDPNATAATESITLMDDLVLYAVWQAK